MTYREKLTWGQLTVWTLFTSVAAFVAGKALLAGQPLREAGVTDGFMVFGALTAVVFWLAGRGVRLSEMDAPDEREQLVELKSAAFGRTATPVAVGLIALTLPAERLADLPAADLKLALIYVLLLVVALGEIADLAARAFLYRAMR